VDHGRLECDRPGQVGVAELRPEVVIRETVDDVMTARVRAILSYPCGTGATGCSIRIIRSLRGFPLLLFEDKVGAFTRKPSR
jgi:hypothetical protein